MLTLAPTHAFERGRVERLLRARQPLHVRLTHIDGKLTNLALMKLAAFHRERGDTVTLTRNVQRGLFEPEYDIVYGSTIFTRSMPLVRALRREFPGALIGGTGLYGESSSDWLLTIEQLIGKPVYEEYDYSIYDYAGFSASLGFTQRGCRMGCRFCSVPEKEGRVQEVNTIANIWRGGSHPRTIHLLDNDFFGQSREAWEARIDEMRSGAFAVCLNQGINVRAIDATIAQAIATIPYMDDSFTKPRLYTAWDNIANERPFVRGVELLGDAGIRPEHLLVYMLVGFDEAETWDRVFVRFNRMVSLGVRPFPMVFEKQPGESNNALPFRELKAFQRWAVRKFYEFVPWAEYRVSTRAKRDQFHDHARQLGLWPET